ncbi:bifunctional hydroxymethylpyrimidine kinase/phosphomethylpyrimidine kinase [Pseudosulfitobacter pseudonitzschiae]|uniref:bifunctional hydroxymethylpyrimidine kinase/phosphomethylpyrimidine kinase n=1 Tax=Pseudosulfitobacter pseudonitzschiae TaxID=1402135 RepID=UPI001AFB224D|nr:bifunctional hydroxymethylpyrimidine kinase/phosphomethylpyrimidine kinase [Pseudosulfitobacter pseudonitzschiae]MBM1817938.1 bifunctional hydroxymethylpyrimidine kinase/phosphomethylpyrimidine kinase [Pseudosulfitobacter pseudonitzschiae]MBM1834996.1 bifunctional hydroxymethylpyrimidine kinase/phosphomethylpyrimidine kinase [Pseudosulfitobacter pseudonitzschiae]MBM1839797.1 bifunctional hydroxymethylpyrimidine kinase/phosphomethylpyrimidine kinase [Pseudosulfitobacter pseudonitzschiae]MBM18
MIPNVLSIAGSDPSGGAGIQADIKAISANGAFAMTALTALTAQNSQGVSDIHFVPPAFVQSQIDAIFADIRVDAAKIGMIATAEVAAAIARSLSGHAAVPVVLDPVMIAKGGASLLQEDAIAALRTLLLPLATVLTPNLPEAAQLLGVRAAATRDEMVEQGQALCALGPQAVLMKGGHLDGATSPDCLVTAQDAIWFEAPRIRTANTHGTGCTLSSALAAQLAKGLAPAAAASAAKSYVSTAVARAGDLSVGTGHGPTHHFASFYANSKG